MDAQFLEELSKSWIVELLTVIGDEYSWNPESTYYCLPNEVLDVFLDYCAF